jgi:hypothetical protein
LYELKIRLVELAATFEQRSNIELDHGYTFSHSIGQFFPEYF